MDLQGYMFFFALAGWLARLKMKQMVNCMCYMNNVADLLNAPVCIGWIGHKGEWEACVIKGEMG